MVPQEPVRAGLPTPITRSHLTESSQRLQLNRTPLANVRDMPNHSHIHIRRLEISDFGFVQDLAAKQRNFTIPPTYVLWLLMRIKDAACFIAEKPRQGLLAYLLAVPSEGPGKSLFVWQLAALPGRPGAKASLSILSALRDFATRTRVRTVGFSVQPRSATYRLISRYSRELASQTPCLTSVLPSLIAKNESEYRIDLRASLNMPLKRSIRPH
jgi:hypothetical protein